MDRFHHVFEHGVKKFPRFFRIAVSEQFRRTLEVGEEHGHLLALTFESRLRGEDLLGQMLRGVGVRRASLDVWANRLTALQAELRRSRQLGSAIRAGQCLARTALQAKLGLGWILMLALRTLHAGSLPAESPGTVGQVTRA